MNKCSAPVSIPNPAGWRCLGRPSRPPATGSVCAAAPGADRSPPAASPVPRRPPPGGPSRRTGTETCRPPAACNSIQNATTSVAATRLVRITHPFHPLSGKQFACVGERYNRYGKRLLLQVDDASICSIPPPWTDLVAPDPEMVIGRSRALFRVADLLDLAQLLDQLGRRVPMKPERV